jgi:site-specific recombinase XerD
MGRKSRKRLVERRRGIPTSGWSRFISTCWRPSAAPARTRSPPMAATLRILPLISKAAGRSVATATTDDLRGYLGDLARRGLAAATVARRLSAIRQLYRFLYAEGPAQGRSGRRTRRSQA